LFTAVEIDLDAFGYNVENRHLASALEARATALKLPRIAGAVEMPIFQSATFEYAGEKSYHDVRYLRYWVDEDAGRIFCLVEAPTAEAAEAVHQEAHGLVADHIYRVQEGS